ncbi:MAG: phosphotransferase enzyme family protein [Mobilitalea sp.]
MSGVMKLYQAEIRKLLEQEYEISALKIEMLSYSNKIVYLITGEENEFILDIYRKKEDESSTAYLEDNQFFTEEAVDSEIRILNILAQKLSHLRTPRIIQTKSGFLRTLIQIDQGEEICLLRQYIYGVELSKKMPDYLRYAYDAGFIAAQLHNGSNLYLSEEFFHRPVRKQDYVNKLIRTIEKGILAGTITQKQFNIIRRSLNYVIQQMNIMDQDSTLLGIVHTDLRAANLLLCADHLIPIDFGRCVYGYLLYDLGEMCAHMGGSNPLVPPRIIAGYHSIRRLSVKHLMIIEAMMLLFILSVVSEKILNPKDSYVLQTIKRLTENDLIQLLSGKPVLPGIREIIK